MNLQHLEYIVEIENCGSISKAAQTLYVTQPYLSKLLRETEEQHGITIFTRSKSGISPTESGRLFLDMARDLLENAGNFQRVFKDRQDGYRLRVSSCTCSHPSDAFIRMISSLPDTDLRFTYKETSNQEVIDDVYMNKADIGILLYPEQDKKNIHELLKLRRLTYHRLFDSSTWLFCRTGHPLLAKKELLTLEDIYQYNFALYPSQKSAKALAVESLYSDATLNMINWNRIRQIIYVHSRSLLHNILERTDYLGIGMTPILEQEENYHIVSIPLPDSLLSKEEKNNQSTLGYIYLKDRELPKAARAYVTFLEECYGERSEYGDMVSKIGL